MFSSKNACLVYRPLPDVTVSALIPRRSNSFQPSLALSRSNARQALRFAFSSTPPSHHYQHPNSSSSSTFTLSHESNGAAAAIVRQRPENDTNITKRRFANDCGVDVVLPSRIRQTRQRWGTKVFTERWLGRENVLAIENSLMMSCSLLENNNNDDTRTLACSIAWAWRESLIKSFCNYTPKLEMEEDRKSFVKTQQTVVTPTFSLQKVKLGKISSRHNHQAVIDTLPPELKCTSVIRCEEIAFPYREADDYELGRLKYLASSTSSMNRGKLCLEAMVLEGTRSREYERIIVVFACI